MREKNDDDHGAGLIHQVASPIAETEPRPICGKEYEDGYRCGRLAGHKHECCAYPALCMDCGKDYSDFDLDLLLPRSQWLELLSQTREHADRDGNDGGVLCAQCIVTRAAKVAGATGIHCVIEISPQRPPR